MSRMTPFEREMLGIRDRPVPRPSRKRYDKTVLWGFVIFVFACAAFVLVKVHWPTLIEFFAPRAY